MISLAVAGVCILALAVSLVRLFAGPTLYDRMLAANSSVVKVTLTIGALGTAMLSPSAIDAAIAILAGGVVFSAAMYKLFKARTFQAPLASAREEG